MASIIPMNRPRAERQLPTRVCVGRFADLRRAEQAAERLTGGRIPDRAIQISASGVRSGMPPANSSNYWHAAMNGLRAGALFGLAFGAIWALTGLGDANGMVTLMLAAVVGAGFGAVAGAVMHWGESDPDRGKHLLEADEFHVLVDEQYEHAARGALPRTRSGEGRFTR